MDNFPKTVRGFNHFALAMFDLVTVFPCKKEVKREQLEKIIRTIITMLNYTILLLSYAVIITLDRIAENVMYQFP